MRLYDLAEQYNDLLEILEGSENPESVYAMLEGLEGKFDEKVESIVKLMRSKESASAAIKAESDRLIKRAEREKKEAQWLKDYVEREMIKTGKEQIKSDLFDIKFKLNPHAVNIVNADLIPPRFFKEKTEISIDKAGISELLKQGQMIPGVELIQRKSLQIK